MRLELNLFFRNATQTQHEQIVPHLCDVGQANKEGYNADDENEYFLSLSQGSGVLIHQSSDETFHGTELWRPFSHLDCYAYSVPYELK